MDNKIIIGLVIGAVALLAVVIFAANPEGQAMLKFATTTFPGTKTSVSGTGYPVDAFTVGEFTKTSKYSATCRKTYTVEGLIIADTTQEAKFKVNGETTDSLKEGETYTCSDGAVLKVLDISTNEGSEAAGADKAVVVVTCKLTIRLG